MAANTQQFQIDEAVRQFAKNFFREREAQGEKPAQLGRRLGRLIGKPKGFSRATMTEIDKDRRGVGNEMRRALATELFSGSIDKLESHAAAWWAQNKERILAIQRGKYSTAERLYPNRGEALDRMDGAADLAAIDVVRQMKLEPDKRDLPILEWMRITMQEHDRFTHGFLQSRPKSTPPPSAAKKK